MEDALARRLITRDFDLDADVNPEGQSLTQIQELKLSPEGWALLLEIEVATKNRQEVITLANERAGAKIEGKKKAAKTTKPLTGFGPHGDDPVESEPVA